MAKPSAGLNRRELLKRSGVVALASFGPISCGGGGRIAVASRQAERIDGQADYLSEAELETLRALVDTLIPEDIDPGGAATGCAEAINGLLSAFSFDPPLIFAGGPFSDRAGAATNDFENFIPLDAYEEIAWRLKIEGSQGLAEREFNGARKGWQAIYREGLARLEERASEFGFGSFSEMPAPTRELLLRDDSDDLIAELVDVAFPHTLDTMYGAPEYGGNRNLNGWGFTDYDGDVQPRGYTDEQVTQPDNPGLFDPLPPGPGEQAPFPLPERLPIVDAEQQQLIENAFAELMAMSSGEFALTAMLHGESRLSRWREVLDRHRPSRMGGQA